MFDFPATPTDGQQFAPIAGGPTYVFQSPVWRLASGGVNAGVWISDGPPSAPVQGMLWWESDSGNSYIYYNDGNSSQWVQFNLAQFESSYINSVPADLYAGFKTGGTGNRFVVNSTVDGSGTDLFTVYEGGQAITTANFTAGNNLIATNAVIGHAVQSPNQSAGVEKFVLNDSAQFYIYSGATYPFVVYNQAATVYTGIGPGIINATGASLSFQGAGTTRASMTLGGNWFFAGASAGYSVDTRGIVSPGCPALIGWCGNMSNYAILGYYSSPTYYPIYGVGASYMSGGWTSSDQRFKQVVETKDGADALADVLAIPVVSYTAKSPAAAMLLGLDETDTSEKFGFLAQDVEKVIPIAVRDIGPPPEDRLTRAFLTGVEMPEEGSKEAIALGEETLSFKGLNDQYLLATLWSAVQQLAGRLATLEAA